MSTVPMFPRSAEAARLQKTFQQMEYQGRRWFGDCRWLQIKTDQLKAIMP